MVVVLILVVLIFVLVVVLVVVLVILVLILVLVVILVSVLIVHFFPPKAMLKFNLSTLLRSILLCKTRLGIIRKKLKIKNLKLKSVFSGIHRIFSVSVIGTQNQFHKLSVILCTNQVIDKLLGYIHGSLV